MSDYPQEHHMKRQMWAVLVASSLIFAGCTAPARHDTTPLDDRIWTVAPTQSPADRLEENSSPAVEAPFSMPRIAEPNIPVTPEPTPTDSEQPAPSTQRASARTPNQTTTPTPRPQSQSQPSAAPQPKPMPALRSLTATQRFDIDVTAEFCKIINGWRLEEQAKDPDGEYPPVTCSSNSTVKSHAMKMVEADRLWHDLETNQGWGETVAGRGGGEGGSVISLWMNHHNLDSLSHEDLVDAVERMNAAGPQMFLRSKSQLFDVALQPVHNWKTSAPHYRILVQSGGTRVRIACAVEETLEFIADEQSPLDGRYQRDAQSKCVAVMH